MKFRNSSRTPTKGGMTTRFSVAYCQVITISAQTGSCSWPSSISRRGEVFRLKWEDVDFGKNAIRLTTRKTRGGSWRNDWIAMNETLRRKLVWWRGQTPYPSSGRNVFVMLDDTPSPNHRPGEEFKGRQHFMRRLCEKAGVRPFGFHAIRHLSASILYKEGLPVSAIQKLLRHTNPTTTEIYLKSLGFDLGAIRETVGVLDGRGPAKVSLFAMKKASGVGAPEA